RPEHPLLVPSVLPTDEAPGRERVEELEGDHHAHEGSVGGDRREVPEPDRTPRLPVPRRPGGPRRLHAHVLHRGPVRLAVPRGGEILREGPGAGPPLHEPRPPAALDTG